MADADTATQLMNSVDCASTYSDLVNSNADVSKSTRSKPIHLTFPLKVPFSSNALK